MVWKRGDVSSCTSSHHLCLKRVCHSLPLFHFSSELWLWSRLKKAQHCNYKRKDYEPKAHIHNHRKQLLILIEVFLPIRLILLLSPFRRPLFPFCLLTLIVSIPIKLTHGVFIPMPAWPALLVRSIAHVLCFPVIIACLSILGLLLLFRSLDIVLTLLVWITKNFVSTWYKLELFLTSLLFRTWLLFLLIWMELLCKGVIWFLDLVLGSCWC